jgi:two-component system, OmpR family, alkaline phosphatase synthesis response regulator PhoP
MLIDLTPRLARVPVLPKRTALIVEDDPRLQRSMSKELGRAGFHVLSALHYDAAVCHLATHRPHLVCVDVGLPAKSGYELCEYIRGPLGLTRVPIIVTSEHGHSEDMAFAEAVGGNAFLCKPFSSRQLTDCVKSLLDRTPSSALPLHELERFASDAIASANGTGAIQAVVRQAPPDLLARHIDASGAAPQTAARSRLAFGEPSPALKVVAPSWSPVPRASELTAHRTGAAGDVAEVSWIPLRSAL